MKEGDMQQLGRWIAAALEKPMDTAAHADLLRGVEVFCNAFPVPGIGDPEMCDLENRALESA
jgi:glycine/serine hydroxymethyltransferase